MTASSKGKIVRGSSSLLKKLFVLKNLFSGKIYRLMVHLIKRKISLLWVHRTWLTIVEKKVVKVSKQHLNKEYFFSLHIKQYFAASLQIPNLYRVRQKICNQTYFPLGSTRWFSKNSPTLATSIIRSAPPPLHKQTGFLDHSHTRNIRKSMWISAFGGSDLATTFCKQTISLRPSAVQPGFTSWANNSGTSDGDMHGIGPTRYIQPFRCVASWVMWCRSDVVEAREATVASNAMVGAESLEWTWGHCFQSAVHFF